MEEKITKDTFVVYKKSDSNSRVALKYVKVN